MISLEYTKINIILENIKITDTDVDRLSELFKERMNNINLPNYYIDSHSVIVWLSCRRKMKVLTNKPLEIILKPNRV